MKIEYRQGNDWEELIVDGESRYSNHSIPVSEFLAIIKELGAKVKEPEGDFCGCGGSAWWPAGTSCPDCGEE